MNAYFAGETDESPRDRFFYVNDDAELVALRVGDWKFIFKEQRAKQLALWVEPFVELRAPKIFNLRRDPFERALDDSNTYWDWMIDHVFMVVPAQAASWPRPIADVRGVPAAPEARIVQPRPRAREAPGGRGQPELRPRTAETRRRQSTPSPCRALSRNHAPKTKPSTITMTRLFFSSHADTRPSTAREDDGASAA